MEEYFSDYDVFTVAEITRIAPHGIYLKNGTLIDFALCARKYREAHALAEENTCIGEVDTSDLSFMFYAFPKPIMIKFIGKNGYLDISKAELYQRFHSLQKQIIDSGYRTSDEY